MRLQQIRARRMLELCTYSSLVKVRWFLEFALISHSYLQCQYCYHDVANRKGHVHLAAALFWSERVSSDTSAMAHRLHEILGFLRIGALTHGIQRRGAGWGLTPSGWLRHHISCLTRLGQKWGLNLRNHRPTTYSTEKLGACSFENMK